MSSLRIQRAGAEDALAIAPLFNLYRQFYQQAPDEEAAWHFISERLRKNESVIFIALKDERAVGFTQLYPIFSSVGMKRCWLLNDLFV